MTIHSRLLVVIATPCVGASAKLLGIMREGAT